MNNEDTKDGGSSTKRTPRKSEKQRQCDANSTTEIIMKLLRGSTARGKAGCSHAYWAKAPRAVSIYAMKYNVKAQRTTWKMPWKRKTREKKKSKRVENNCKAFGKCCRKVLKSTKQIIDTNYNTANIMTYWFTELLVLVRGSRFVYHSQRTYVVEYPLQFINIYFLIFFEHAARHGHVYEL